MLVANSQGMVVGDIQPLTRLNVTCIVEENGNRQIGSFGGGGRVEFGFFVDNKDYERYAREAVRQAILNLERGRCAGRHHGRRPRPRLAGNSPARSDRPRLRRRFQSQKDFGLLPIASAKKSLRSFARWSTTAPSRRAAARSTSTTKARRRDRTVLIENGILKGYLQDKLNAGLMKMALTGNGRRESYAHIPMPRMTNTFMLAGESAPEDIIRSVKKGLYAVSFGGGQVDITSGKFVFSASEAYLIEDGKVTQPVKGATLIGNGPDVLTRVSMVGNDLKLDEGVGTCGKDGQSVPVGVGLPTIKIDGLTVGGTAA